MMEVRWCKIGYPQARKPEFLKSYFVADHEKVLIRENRGMSTPQFDAWWRHGDVHIAEYWAEIPPLPSIDSPEEHGEWIVEKEHRPEPYQEIVATDGREVWKSYMHPNIDLYFGERYRWTRWWMPLPEPPKKGRCIK